MDILKKEIDSIVNSLALNEDTDETEQARENEKNHEDYNEEKAERDLEPVADWNLIQE